MRLGPASECRRGGLRAPLPALGVRTLTLWVRVGAGPTLPPPGVRVGARRCSWRAPRSSRLTFFCVSSSSFSLCVCDFLSTLFLAFLKMCLRVIYFKSLGKLRPRAGTAKVPDLLIFSFQVPRTPFCSLIYPDLSCALSPRLHLCASLLLPSPSPPSLLPLPPTLPPVSSQAFCLDTLQRCE